MQLTPVSELMEGLDDPLVIPEYPREQEWGKPVRQCVLRGTNRSALQWMGLILLYERHLKSMLARPGPTIPFGVPELTKLLGEPQQTKEGKSTVHTWYLGLSIAQIALRGDKAIPTGGLGTQGDQPLWVFTASPTFNDGGSSRKKEGLEALTRLHLRTVTHEFLRDGPGDGGMTFPSPEKLRAWLAEREMSLFSEYGHPPYGALPGAMRQLRESIPPLCNAPQLRPYVEYLRTAGPAFDPAKLTAGDPKAIEFVQLASNVLCPDLLVSMVLDSTYSRTVELMASGEYKDGGPRKKLAPLDTGLWHQARRLAYRLEESLSVMRAWGDAPLALSAEPVQVDF